MFNRINPSELMNRTWAAIGVAGASLIAGGVQAASGAKRAKRAERELEKMQPPEYAPNQSIMDFYNEALRKYNVNPTDTREYKATSQAIKQGTVQGLNYLQDRRSGLAGIPALINNQNKNILDTAVREEQRKDRDFGILQSATAMKAGEGNKEFQYNKIAPFEKNYNLLALKGGAANQLENAGWSNIFGGISSAGQIYAASDRSGNSGGNDNSWFNSYKNNYGRYRALDPRYGG